jgi:hypothetical protein
MNTPQESTMRIDDGYDLTALPPTYEEPVSDEATSTALDCAIPVLLLSAITGMVGLAFVAHVICALLR